MMAFVFGPTASRSWSPMASYVPISTSTKTGMSPFWMIGLSVVGKPAATVMTSSPGLSCRLPSFGLVSAESAHEVGRRAAVDEGRGAGADVVREGVLELGGPAAGGEPAVERRVDQGDHVVGVEHLARDRDGRLPGDELSCGQRDVGELTHAVQDRLSADIQRVSHGAVLLDVGGYQA